MGEISQADESLINSLKVWLFDESNGTGQSQWSPQSSRAFGFDPGLYREVMPSRKNFSDLKFRYGQLLVLDRGDAILSVHMKSGYQLRLLLGAGFEWVRILQDETAKREAPSRLTNAKLLFDHVYGILKGGTVKQAEAKQVFIKQATEWSLFEEGSLTLCDIIACPDNHFTAEYLKLVEENYLAFTS